MKILSYILLFLFFSCTGKTNILEKNYLLNNRLTIDYKNEYNEKGLLVNVLETNTFESFFEGSRGKDISLYENIYTYDQRDSLVNKKVYSIYENNEKELYSEDVYTDSTSTLLVYGKNPTDSTYYSHSVKDKNGNYIETYKKDWYINNSGEQSRSVNRYDENSRLVESEKKDLVNNTETMQTFKYEVKNDTLFTYIYQDNKLDVFKKKFNTKEYTIELSEFYGDYPSTDSLFYKDNKEVRYIGMRDGERREQIIEYDQYGNITKSVESIYMTKEAREKQKKEWGIE